MTTAVGTDVALIGTTVLVIAIHLCRRRCHAKMTLPFPLPGKKIMQAWDAVEDAGWEVQDPLTTLTVDGGVQTHHLARPGVTNSFEQCEAES